jgi:glycogen operon protein
VLDRLARAAGIAPEWNDVQGRRHAVGDDTRRALLAAMGLEATTTGQARARLAELAARRERRALPRTLVVMEGTEARVPIAVDDRKRARHGVLHVHDEQGAERGVPFNVDDLPGDSIVACDGGIVSRHSVTLPVLAAGIYTVVRDNPCRSACRLVVAPRACFLPVALRNGGRRFGLAAHLYALRRRRDQGIGDFTTLREAGAATAAAGGAILALNPLHALFTDRTRASPYHPSDRRFLDPIYIDVENVPDFEASSEARRLLELHAQTIQSLSERSTVDYVGVWRAKLAVLALCFRTFERRGRDDGLAREFERFVNAGGAELMRFATFQSIADVHNGPWINWPSALRRPDGDGVSEFARNNASGVRFALYLQWLADRQLGNAAEALRGCGLAFGLCRDLAVGAAPDGAEAWATQGEPCARRFHWRAAGSIRGLGPGLEPAPTPAGGASRGRLRGISRTDPCQRAARRRVAHRPRHGTGATLLGAGRRIGRGGRLRPLSPGRSAGRARAGKPSRALHHHRGRPRHGSRRISRAPWRRGRTFLPASMVPARRRGVSPAVTILGQSCCLRLDARPAHVRRMVERSRHR